MSLLLENIPAIKICKAVLDMEIKNYLSRLVLGVTSVKIPLGDAYTIVPYIKNIKTRVVEVDEDSVYLGIDVSTIGFKILPIGVNDGEVNKDLEIEAQRSLVVKGGTKVSKRFGVPSNNIKYLPIIVMHRENNGYAISGINYNYLDYSISKEKFVDLLYHINKLINEESVDGWLHLNSSFWKSFTFKVKVKGAVCQSSFGG